MLKKGDIIELEIESLAFGGSGIGKFGEEKLAIFVEDTVPGDLVKVEIGTRKKKYAYGYLREILKKSDARIKPHCAHFGERNEDFTKGCGGCALQFMSYENQLLIKEQHVRDAVTRIGGFKPEIVLPILGCKSEWYYRNKMEFSFSRDKNDKLGLGLHLRRMHHDVVELSECFLMESFIGNFVSGMREMFRELDSQKRIDGLKSLIVRIGKNTGELMINLLVENLEPWFLKEFEKEVKKFCTDYADFKLESIFLISTNNQKGKPKTVSDILLYGKPIINEKLELSNGDTFKFEISPQAFFQTNTKQAEKLYSLTIDAAELSGDEVLYDLFCGTGTIGICASRKAKKVYGIELNQSAVINARKNALINEASNIDFVVGDVTKLVGNMSQKPDVIIVDPPRNGLNEEIINKCSEFGPERIVYVSCNPTTMARDLNLFTKTGYKLLSVQPVDMFPQTYHIECVAKLIKLSS